MRCNTSGYTLHVFTTSKIYWKYHESYDHGCSSLMLLSLLFLLAHFQILQFSSDGQVLQVPAKFEYLQNPSTHLAAIKMFSARWKILQLILLPSKCLCFPHFLSLGVGWSKEIETSPEIMITVARKMSQSTPKNCFLSNLNCFSIS